MIDATPAVYAMPEVTPMFFTTRIGVGMSSRPSAKLTTASFAEPVAIGVPKASASTRSDRPSSSVSARWWAPRWR